MGMLRARTRTVAEVAVPHGQGGPAALRVPAVHGQAVTARCSQRSWGGTTALLRPSALSWGTARGLRGSLASLHVAAVGREFLLDAASPFGRPWQCLLLDAEGIARDRRFPPRCHRASGHADLLEAEIWDETGDIRIAEKNNALRAAGGAQHFWKGRYPLAALPAHGAAEPAPAPRHSPRSAGFCILPRTG